MELKNLRILALERFAHKISDFNSGVKNIKDLFILSSLSADDGTSIIDLSPGLGSSTAYLALGCNISKKDVEIHSIDTWDFKENGELKDKWEKNLFPFCSDTFQIFGHRKSCFDFVYESQKPISVYVDNLHEDKETHDFLFRNFLPFFIPGVTVFFLMNYDLYETKPLQYQRIFMELNSHIFFFLGHCGLNAASFVYLGGGENIVYPEIKFNDEER